MDKATPTPSPASVESVMAKAMMLVGAFNKTCKETSSEPFNEAVTALRAEVERLAAQAARDDAALYQTIGERDNYHKWADQLANGIAAHLGIEIGEHSAGMGSAESNNPWANALEAIQSAAQSAPTDRWHDAALPPEIEQRLAPWLTNGAALHPATVNLVVRFARALSKKLSAAEVKYGYSDGWMSPDWMDECRAKLMEHISKGDPRDVAAYCAFLWHHGESTVAQSLLQGGRPPLPEGKAVIRCVADTEDGGWVADFDCEGPLSHEPKEGDVLFTTDQMHAYFDVALAAKGQA